MCVEMMHDNTKQLSKQADRILAILRAREGSWVPLPEIMACAAQYNARIFELRRRGFTIENRTETDSETGARHSWFRFVNPASRAYTDPKPVADASVSNLGERSESTLGKVRPDETASADNLPLFAAVR